jgi:tRNA threonylcarbamoyladenosine biosynthesis protein TsaB
VTAKLWASLRYAAIRYLLPFGCFQLLPFSSSPPEQAVTTLLAFDTATETMSIALAARGSVSSFEAAGGALASAALIPAILTLLSKAGVALLDVEAIAFGRGPGAFTGLRTACSVAQGLALGADKPVLPIDSLLAVAADAISGLANFDSSQSSSIWVAMDARMDEIYAAHYGFAQGRWTTLVAPLLASAEALNDRWKAQPPRVIAGNALTVFAERLAVGDAQCVPGARPRATAMLPLAQALWDRGGAVDAALALPLYVRDKVAQTTIERDVARAAKAAEATRAAQGTTP